MPTKTWNTFGSDDWTTQDDWDPNPPGTPPGDGDDVVIDQGDPQIQNEDVGTVKSVTVGSAGATEGTLDLDNGKLATSADFTIDAGSVNIDTTGSAGGSVLTIGDMLSNGVANGSGRSFNFGTLNIGNSSLTGATTVDVNGAGGFPNLGSLNLIGNAASGTSCLATLHVAGAAGTGTAGYLTGTVDVSGDALLEFDSGSITNIDSGASLTLDGTQAHIALAGATTSNSALTKLAENDGFLDLADGGSVTTNATNFTNTANGSVTLERSGTLAIGGTFSNAGNINLNGAASATPTAAATLDIHSAAGLGTTGHVSGGVFIADNSLLEFDSGGITQVDSGATLSLSGAEARVAIAADTTTNSALTALTENMGGFYLDNGATVTEKTGTNFTNDGDFRVSGGQNDTTFTITGNLTNSSFLSIGQGEADSATVNVDGSFTNSGQVFLEGGTTGHATFDVVNGAAGFGTPGHLTGAVNLSGDALLEFKSGGITNIDANASLDLDGSQARVALVSDTTTNSALTGLSRNDGAFVLADGASDTIGTNFSNTGRAFLEVDGINGEKGSTLTINGTLTSAGFIDIGNNNSTGSTNLNGTGTLAVTGGTTTLYTDARVSVAHLTDSGDGTLEIFTPASQITSTIGFAAGASSATLQIDAPALATTGGTFADVIHDFGAGDAIELSSLHYDGNATATYNAGTLTITESGITDTLKLANPGATQFQAAQATDGSGGTVLSIVCFCTSTRIRTTRGDVAVEALAVGELAVTASGAARPIKWIGKRSFDCAAHPTPAMVRPIRVQAGAFGSGKPYRDLTLSPHHAVAVTCVGEMLIPIRLLVNGSTIVQIDHKTDITYWHVELDSHDILIANGLPAESYIDVGNRCDFEGEPTLTLHPKFKSDALAGYCRPLVMGGPVLSAVRAQLSALAGETERQAADPAPFHLLVDGTPITPIVDGNRAAFVVPASARDLRLVSPAWSPHDADKRITDTRRLGLLIQSLAIDDLLGTSTGIPLDHPALVAGFHPVERTEIASWRWTDGDALLSGSIWNDQAGPFVLRLTGQFHQAETAAAASTAA